ncbi:hypothetical protein EI94DRAFT_1734025 [Lactarius quietus]|nr:hypothetical protein EI94DRAFT_1734025 [Lactarius quietus]
MGQSAKAWTPAYGRPHLHLHLVLTCRLVLSSNQVQPTPKYCTAVAVTAALSRRPRNATGDSAAQDQDTPHRFVVHKTAGSTLQCRICLCVRCRLLLELTLTQTLERRDRSSYDARSGVLTQRTVYGTGWRLAIINRSTMRGSMLWHVCCLARSWRCGSVSWLLSDTPLSPPQLCFPLLLVMQPLF